MTQLQAIEPANLALTNLSGKTKDYVANSKAENTRIALRRDWKLFSAWCERNGLAALPATPNAVAMFLAAEIERGCAVSSTTRRLSSISVAHQTAGYETPTKSAVVKMTLQGIRRTHQTAQRGKEPLLITDIRAMIAKLPDNVKGIRDAAILSVGWAGAFRRSEIINLMVEDLSFGENGVVVTIRKSKTDQDGEGRKVAIPYGKNTCPVSMLRQWLEVAAAAAGYVFRPINRHGHIFNRQLGDEAIASLVKEAAKRASIDPDKVAGHSLRSGFITTCASLDIAERKIANTTGHRSMTVLRRYIKNATVWQDNAAMLVGL